MENWIGLVGNALWIVGLAAWLAVLSMARYEARTGTARLWSRLEQPDSQLALALGACLFGVGLLLRGGTWWERGIWALATVFLAVWAVRSWRRLGTTGEGGR